tara:strand:- start:29 stop:370 length:342 start_codon:yes stop_codon:yes gene_type:complete
MTKYSMAEEGTERIRANFAENIAVQADFRNFFTKNPSEVRTRKELEEMSVEGLTNEDGLIVDKKTGQPAEQSLVDKVMKRVDERMLTEGNSLMREYNMNYSGGKILPMAEAKN